jgi:HEPN domain-containing protein
MTPSFILFWRKDKSLSKKTDAGSPGDWLDFASADLDAVNLLAKQKVAFRVCRSKLAEALEKILKADLISRGWMLEKTHDLQRLADCLNEYDQPQTENIQAVIDELAEAYTQSRYPGFDLDDAEDWQGLRAFIGTVEKYRLAVGSKLTHVLAPPNQHAPSEAGSNPAKSPLRPNTSVIIEPPSSDSKQ